jgi:CubicO group peptidase (beta-lactamase class C family)
MRSSICMLAICLTIGGCREAVPAASASDTASDRVVAGLSLDRLGRVDEFLEAEVRERRIPGAVAMVVRNDTIVHTTVVGKADLERGADMRRDTLFRLASMTKLVTTIAALQLFERGRFTMDTPLRAILPEFADTQVYVDYDPARQRFVTRPPSQPILMKHVFTHTSGIAYPHFASAGSDGYVASGVAGAFYDPAQHPDLAAEIRKIASLPLAHDPGAGYTYGMNMDVLGRVIEVLDGRSFPRYVREEIFAPLGLQDTYFGVPSAEWPRVATLYVRAPEGLTPFRRDIDPYRMHRFPAADVDTYWKAEGTEMAMGGADLVGTAADYARVLQVLLNHGTLDGTTVLGRNTVEMLGSVLASFPTSILGVPRVNHGLSVLVNTTEDVAFQLDSEGAYYWAGGFGTHFWVDPKENLACLILTQVAPIGPFRQGTHAMFRHLVYASLVN